MKHWIVNKAAASGTKILVSSISKTALHGKPPWVSNSFHLPELKFSNFGIPGAKI